MERDFIIRWDRPASFIFYSAGRWIFTTLAILFTVLMIVQSAVNSFDPIMALYFTFAFVSGITAIYMDLNYKLRR